MPTLTVSSNPNYTSKTSKTNKTNKANPGPLRPPLPPDITGVLEGLFYIVEKETDIIAPTPAWFLAEAFAAQQWTTFRSTDALQHFLHLLLDAAYMGPTHIGTYLLPVVFGFLLEGVVTRQSTGVVLQKIEVRLQQCLVYWGVKRDRRQEITEKVLEWTRKTLKHISPTAYDTMEALLRYIRERGVKLAGRLL